MSKIIDRELNPMGNLYDSFLKILKNITIKYSYQAQLNETVDTKRAADGYIDAKLKRDTFDTYVDYTEEEINDVYDTIYPTSTGLSVNPRILRNKVAVINGDYSSLSKNDPDSKKIKQLLLEKRRQRTLDEYEELNDYYRTLNGMPLDDDPLSDEPYDVREIEDPADPSYGSRIRTERAGEWVPENIARRYDPDGDIAYMPVYSIEDYLNELYASSNPNHGTHMISALEGSLFIDKTISKIESEIKTLTDSDNEDDHEKAKTLKKRSAYLYYVGSNRIDIIRARQAKNFEILQIRHLDIKQNILDAFITIYGQCRDYFMKVIYVPQYHDFFEYYDNFIAMSIMIMTIQQVVDRQIFSTVDRNFFDINAVRALYEAYAVPFDLTIDEDTQNQLVRNLNMLIHNKATDGVLYNIAELLGFSNVKIYKYYLGRQYKYDGYGVPVIAHHDAFNTETGEVDKDALDRVRMFTPYFHKVDVRDEHYVSTFYDHANDVSYEEVTSGDPFWWEDEGTWKRVWEDEYNFVESKYMSVGVSYNLTEIMFECVILFRMILDKPESFSQLSVKLPRITQDMDVSVFDTIVLLVCLTSAKHDLYGEIITIPSQVAAVLDYIKSHDGDTNLDTLKFNINYLYHPDKDADKKGINDIKQHFLDYMKDLNKYEEAAGNISNTVHRHSYTATDDKYIKLYDENKPTEEVYKEIVENAKTELNNFDKGEHHTYTNLAFNFDYLSPNNPNYSSHMARVEKLIGKTNIDRFRHYVKVLSTDMSVQSRSDRIVTFNAMFADVKHIYSLLRYCMDNAYTREQYEEARSLYQTLFYSREMSNVFTISLSYVELDPDNKEGNTVGDTYTINRTAFTYFEYLNYIDPKLYSAIFYVDYDEEYAKYLSENGYTKEDHTYERFEEDVAKGDWFIDYSRLKEEYNKETANLKDERIYYYVNHIIGRLQLLLKNIQFMYMIIDTSTPLEELLMKLVRFFKSYTVDMLDLSTIYICDLKPDQTIRMFDEIAKIHKWIEPNEDLHISYDDVISSMVSIIHQPDFIYMRDKMYYTLILYIDAMCKKDTSVLLKDDYFVHAYLPSEEDYFKHISDVVSNFIQNENIHDQFGLHDKAIIHYSDEDYPEPNY